MADGDKAEAGSVSRIGERIDKATGGQVKYESYSQDQNLGQPTLELQDPKAPKNKRELKDPADPRQYIAVEAAIAAIMDNPNATAHGKPLLKEVFHQLKEQAKEREGKTTADLEKILKGEKLDGLPPSPVVNGKVVLGGLFMSDEPTDANLQAKDAADPKKLDADRGKLKIADAVLKDSRWKVAEAASNLTNAMRDVEIMANGHKLTDEQAKAIEKGVEAEQKILHQFEKGKLDLLITTLGRTPNLEQQVKDVEGAMDAAAQAAGVKPDDYRYQHYREDMDKNIRAGIADLTKTLHTAGVTQAEKEAGIATTSTAKPKTADLPSK